MESERNEIRVKVEDLSLAYEKNQYVIKNYNFEIREGEVLGILGRNGCGKTTLFKGILGLLPYYKGKIEKKGKCGYLPVMNEINYHQSVEEVIVLGQGDITSIFYQPTEELYEKTRSLMKELGLFHLFGKNYAHLSTGQKQMIHFAKMMINNPTLIFLDEPSIGLDFKYYNQMMTYLKKEIEKKKISIFLISQNPMYLSYFANKMLLMYENEYCFGTWDQVMTEENLSKLYHIAFYKTQIERQDGNKIDVFIPKYD